MGPRPRKPTLVKLKDELTRSVVTVVGDELAAGANRLVTPAQVPGAPWVDLR